MDNTDIVLEAIFITALGIFLVSIIGAIIYSMYDSNIILQDELDESLV